MIGSSASSPSAKRKRTEVELTEAKKIAEAASNSRRDFIATASHDLRTPLNIIIGYNDMLHDTGLTPQQQELSARLGAAAQMLLALTNNILDFSKIDAGVVQLRPRAFCVAELLATLGQTFSKRATERGLSLEWETERSIPEDLVGDPDRLLQVMANLLDNAIKFTPAGRIVVRAALAEDGGDRVGIRFSVSDTGIGIRHERQEQVFDPFSQEDSSHFEGTGLGLAICRRLADLMGGKTGVESELGKGSTFWFTVPLQRLAESPRS
jgi:signal transduction histidine kinase